MQPPLYRATWNSVFTAVLLLLACGIYFSGKKIDYNWNWQRVIPYIVNEAEDVLYAPSDGSIEISTSQQWHFIPSDGSAALEIGEEYQLNVFEGDLIFEADQLATRSSLKLGPLTEGLIMTINISLWSLLIALVLGLVIGLMRISVNPALNKLALCYVELIRGTPLLVQIFIVYFFIGTVFDLERFTAGVAALGIFTAAYVAEIIRAGIQSIPKGQMEAARSLGMSYVQAMIYVILPQAFKRTLPPLAGQFINLIKDSSLVSVISITDLTKAGREVVSGSFAPFEVWFTVALLYLVLTSSLSWAIARLERRLAKSD